MSKPPRQDMPRQTMPRQTMACPHCGRENYAYAGQCWLCFGQLNVGEQPLRRPSQSSTGQALRILAIVFGALGLAAAVAVSVAVALFVICLAAISGSY